MNTDNRTHQIAGIAALAASLAWAVLWTAYIAYSLGLDTLPALPPDVIAPIVFMLFLPPVLIWVMVGYWTRGRGLAEQSESINRQLERLTIADG
ncbi:MAG: hypothetical protein ABUL54_08940, partial [Dongia sp.]